MTSRVGVPPLTGLFHLFLITLKVKDQLEGKKSKSMNFASVDNKDHFTENNKQKILFVLVMQIFFYFFFSCTGYLSYFLYLPKMHHFVMS